MAISPMSYALDGSFEPHNRRDDVAVAGSMDTTIANPAPLWVGVLARFILGETATPRWREYNPS